ncbi:hypothetical protein LLH03_01190 [bacterium]|nr:hypothetical protein [bacterium]
MPSQLLRSGQRARSIARGYALLIPALLGLVTLAHAQSSAPAQREWVSFDGPGAPQVRLETKIPAESARTAGPEGQGAWHVVVPDMSRDERACAFSFPVPKLEGQFTTARLWLKGGSKTKRVEVVFRTTKGNYGADVTLTPEWREVVLGPRETGPLLGTRDGNLVLAETTQVRLCFGEWQGNTGGPQEVSLGPITAVALPVLGTPLPPESVEAPRVPLPLQPFTVELLDLARGQWRFPDALGQRLELPGPVSAQAFAGASQGALRLAYLCCDPEFPDDLQHATLRVAAPLRSEGDQSWFRIEEPYLACTVVARQAQGGVYQCELRDITLGPATTGDRYLAAMYLMVGDKPCLLQLVPEGGEGLQVRLTTNHVGHVFSGAEPVRVTLTGLCPGAAQTCQLDLKLSDYATGEALWHGTQTLSCDARSCTDTTLTLPLERFGVFELVAEGGPQPATLRVCRVPTPRQVDPDASTIGMNIFQQQIWWYAYQVPLMAQAGVHWIRPWLAWENVWSVQQPTADVWDTRALDAALRRMESYRMEYQAILFNAPQWVTGNAGWRAPPEERLGLWSGYVRRLVSQYKDRIQYWEVWNEPDLMWQEQTRHSGAHYVAVLKAAWEAAKAADPNCKVLGLSHAGYMEWLERVGQLGAKDYFDIATIHSYAAPSGYSAAVKQRRDMLARYGMGDKPLWINELGATAYDFSPEYSRKYSCSELKQASVLTANYALSLSEDPRMKAFWFCTYDPRDSAHESGWAWDAGIGVLYLGFLPKLSYAALAGVSHELDGRECLGRAEIGGRRASDQDLGLHQVSFAGPVAVVWADHPERAAQVPATELGCLASERLQVRDAFTNPVAAGLAGDLRLDLSHGPLYVQGSAQMAAAVRVQQSVSLSTAQVSLSPGDKARVAVQAPGEADVTAEPSPDLAVTTQVTRAEDGTRTVVLSADAETDRASGVVLVRARFARGSMGLLTPLVVERELAVSIGAPNLLRDGGLQAPGLSQWTPERTSPYSWDAAVSHSGLGSLRLEGPFDRRLVHWHITPTAGRAMKVRAWARSRDLAGGLVTLNVAFFGDKWLGSWCLAATGPVGELETGWRVLPDLGRLPSGTTDWTLVEAVLPAESIPAGAATAAFYIDAKGGGSGTIWFDDLDLWQPAEDK